MDDQSADMRQNNTDAIHKEGGATGSRVDGKTTRQYIAAFFKASSMESVLSICCEQVCGESVLVCIWNVGCSHKERYQTAELACKVPFDVIARKLQADYTAQARTLRQT